MRLPLRPLAAALALAALAGCAVQPTAPEPAPAPPPLDAEIVAMYATMQDGDRTVAAIDPKYLSADKARQQVDYWSDQPPGTIVVDPWARFLYFVEEDNKALRYAVAVGEEGRGFSGEAKLPYQRDWPRWTPTQSMLAEDPELYEPVRGGMEGGDDNPLGARALYIHRDGRDTLYRIHGTPYPWTVGKATSAGCIRLFNQDIIDLADRVAGVPDIIVLTEAETGKWTVPPGMPLPANANSEQSEKGAPE